MRIVSPVGHIMTSLQTLCGGRILSQFKSCLSDIKCSLSLIDKFDHAGFFSDSSRTPFKTPYQF